MSRWIICILLIGLYVPTLTTHASAKVVPPRNLCAELDAAIAKAPTFAPVSDLPGMQTCRVWRYPRKRGLAMAYRCQAAPERQDLNKAREDYERMSLALHMCLTEADGWSRITLDRPKHSNIKRIRALVKDKVRIELALLPSAGNKAYISEFTIKQE